MQENNIVFSKPRVSLYEWLKEGIFQLKLLKCYRDVESRVLYSMRHKIITYAKKCFNETEYVKNYNEVKKSKKLSSTWRRRMREEANELLTCLYYYEKRILSEYELYRRGSCAFKKQIEEKWLKDVALTI